MHRFREGSFLAAAYQLLSEAKEPLHYREITRRALERKMVSTEGQAPEAVLAAQLSTHLKRKDDKSTFVRVAPGVFGLREWAGSELASEGEDEEAQTFVVEYPVYLQVQAALRLWNGLPRAAVTGMQSEIFALRGSPQDTVDWKDPDEWIPERLTGSTKDLAMKTWVESGRQLNPRYARRNWALINHHRLFADDGGSLRLTERGRRFLESAEGEVVQEIDLSEGLIKVLEMVAEHGQAARADLFGQWRSYLLDQGGTIRAENPAKMALWSRLRNLTERGLLERSGQRYSPTEEGLAYLQAVGSVLPSSEPDLPQQIRKLIAEQRRKVRQEIHEHLAEMDPYEFEHLVKRLLEEMGYDDVEVTRRSGDRGVDVVGSIEVGISSVREVVQVKRQRGNVLRPVLDQLRGVLFQWNAVRGTIITTGNFSKGTREVALAPGGAPITLIDGEKLIELLIEHRIGVRPKPLELLEVDVEDLLESSSDESGVE